MDKDTKSKRSEWHIDKRLNIGHLITTLLVVVSMVTWFNTLETKVITNIQAIGFNTERIENQEAQQKQDRAEIMDSLLRIETHIYEKKNY